MGQGIGIGRERGSADEGKLLIRTKLGNLFILDYDKSSVAGEVRGVVKVKRRHIGNPRLDIGNPRLDCHDPVLDMQRPSVQIATCNKV